MNATGTTSVTIATEGMPAVIPLSGGALACMTCGVSVAPPHPSTEVEGFGSTWKDLTPGSPRDGRTPTDAVLMTRCAECRATHERADALLDEHPAVLHTIGGRSIALHLVEGPLAALDATGQPAPTVRSDRDLSMLVDQMAALGGMRWASQFATRTYRPGTAPQTCASARWAYLTPVQRQRLRDAVAEYLRARVERPRAYAPPADADRPGCLLCGIAVVVVLPSQSREAWRVVTVEPRALGGQHGAETINGYLCATCGHAVEQAGSIGPTAMERSLMLYLGIRPSGYEIIELDGLTGWGTLENAEPNDRPWGHIPNLAQIAGELR